MVLKTPQTVYNLIPPPAGVSVIPEIQHGQIGSTGAGEAR